MRVAALAIQGEDEVDKLVEDSHRVERPRVDGALGGKGRVANDVHAVGEVAARGQIDENDVGDSENSRSANP